jgi:uncharacterized protein
LTPEKPDRISFLSARWERLLLLTYDIDPQLLAPYLPPGIVPDTIDERAFISLVAFDFLDTKVIGIRWTGYINFPEINLRFYVRHPDGRRGVVFIREYVPKRLIAWLARMLYNEPYQAAPMTSSWTESEDSFQLQHELRVGTAVQQLQVELGKNPAMSTEDSMDHFFKEHSWGFGQTRSGRLLEYEVWHPFWETLPVKNCTLKWDWGAVYGEEWAFLANQKPFHKAFALGSEIRVYPKSIL